MGTASTPPSAYRRAATKTKVQVQQCMFGLLGFLSVASAIAMIVLTAIVSNESVGFGNMRGVSVAAANRSLVMDLPHLVERHFGGQAPQDIGQQQEGHQQQQPKEPLATVAYAVSMTGCSKDPNLQFVQGAAVVAHSIRLNSWPRNASSQFGYHLVAFVHPSAQECAAALRPLGWELQIRETPIQLDKIPDGFYKESVQTRGCCGEKEFLKLYAYALMDYPLVVHLDLDSLLLQPLDHLYHYMLYGTHVEKVKVMFPTEDVLPTDPARISALFTRDYNMINPGKKRLFVGVQGGFLIVKPNMDIFQDYIDIVHEGNFIAFAGWGQLGYGGYFGGQQIQGIVAYYYGEKAEARDVEAIELNRCVYNQMADNPYFSKKPNQESPTCRTHETEGCQDCREAKLADIFSAHFTLCQKPWLCRSSHGLCQELHHQWFRTRQSLDIGLWGAEEQARMASGTHQTHHFLGYCNGAGERGFIPVELPSSSLDR